MIGLNYEKKSSIISSRVIVFQFARVALMFLCNRLFCNLTAQSDCLHYYLLIQGNDDLANCKLRHFKQIIVVQQKGLPWITL